MSNAAGTIAAGTSTALHLVLGEEELLGERAVSAVVAGVRALDPEADTQRVRAGDVTGPELIEMLSPSLFAQARVLVLEATQEAGKDAASLIVAVIDDLPEGMTLVLRHTGGARGKSVVDAATRAGATRHDAAPLRSGDLPAFVRAELAMAGARASADAVEALIDAVGSSLRELAAACAQLVADTGTRVDVAAVRHYHSGRAEVTGFDVAEAAVAGDRALALESLRWAVHRGVADVLLADALADAVRTLARVGAAGRGDPFSLASELGMPAWKVRRAQAQVRGWSGAAVGQALQVVAALNADVKGAAADPGYAIERAVLAVTQLRGT
ncbi:MAG: DNA polymerase III subunit delta [Mycobacteriaceae bacterium]